MKRIAALLLALLFSALLPACADNDAVTRAEVGSALRLHVIADSDDIEAQSIKLAVRDALLEVMRGSAQSAKTQEEAKEMMLKLGSELQSAAEGVLASRGADYGVQLISGEFTFPDRVYGDILYPEGAYSALRVVLGSGEGQNWWCVMFPPLCVIDSADAPAEFEADGTLAFRSFFSELFCRIFGGGAV